MAKTKQSGSAAQRRAQERQQRQRRDDGGVFLPNKGKNLNKGPKMRKKNRSGLYMVIGVVALIAAIIVAFVLISRIQTQTQANTNPNLKAKPADATVVGLVTGVSQSTWEAVGTGKGTVTNNFKRTSAGQPPLTGPNGHPEFFYVGGEYCPYCAAQRWAMINALSRFGTFSKLSQLQSYEANVPTFSFYGSSYSSQYVDFNPKEVNGNQLDSSGQSYVPLEQLTSAEQQTFLKYNSGGNFPFVDIGNQYVAIGATYPYTTLLDSSQKPLSWQDIASSLNNPSSPIAQGILGTANYMTAAICSVTNQQPGNVCNSSVIQQIEHSLNTTSDTTGGSPLVSSPIDRRSASRLALG